MSCPITGSVGLPYIERAGALLMAVPGSYIVYYWLFKGGLIYSFA